MARSLMVNYEEIKHQRQHHTSIENLYDKAQSAVLSNGSTGEWFRTTVGVRQGCLLSPTLFNIFLERIMCEALDDHEGSVSIGGRLITNFRFADDIVVNAEEEEEAGVLEDPLDRTTTRYKMEIGPDNERCIQALKMRCYRSLLNISYKDHVTNEEVRSRIHNAIGVQDDLLTMVKKRKLRWCCHISRSSGMAKTILRFPQGSGRQGRMERQCCNVSVLPRRPPRLKD